MLEQLICLEQGPYRFCVAPNLGGHIVEYSIEGRNALSSTSPEIGSTFWPSPQQAWGWPPPQVLDKGQYRKTRVTDNEIVLTSEVCPLTGLQLEKRFVLLSDRLEVEYTMINPGKVPLQYAPWEITRVSGGITFYKSEQPPLSQSIGSVQSANGFYWYDYKPQAQTENEKIFANGSAGWLANANAGLLLIKQFAAVASADVAPGEAEVEIYGHGDVEQPYIEVEQQGPYQIIAPAGRVQWAVTWFLREIPASIAITTGFNSQLPELVVETLTTAK